MQGRQEPAFKPPKTLAAPKKASKSRRKRAVVDFDEGPEEIMSALRAFRLSEAQRRSVPNYVVFNDRTMRGIAAALPRNESEFVAVSGLGPGRWTAYGPRLLEILADF